MPFTLSHPALVLPIYQARRHYFSLTGLVIGSITPDFEYFVRMKAKSIHSHTFLGVFWFNLPLALLLTFIFHEFIRNPLISNLPLPLFRRFSNDQHFKWSLYFKSKWRTVIISVLIGVGSHLLWDWFIHASVIYLTMSDRIDSKSITEHNITQYIIFLFVNSLAGAILLFTAIYKLPVQDEYKREKYKSWYWWIIFLFTCIIYIIRWIFGTSIVFYDIALILLAAFFLALTVTSLLLRFY